MQEIYRNMKETEKTRQDKTSKGEKMSTGRSRARWQCKRQRTNATTAEANSSPQWGNRPPPHTSTSLPIIRCNNQQPPMEIWTLGLLNCPSSKDTEAPLSPFTYQTLLDVTLLPHHRAIQCSFHSDPNYSVQPKNSLTRGNQYPHHQTAQYIRISHSGTPSTPSTSALHQ